MARLFVLCALIGAALANPTPQTLPKSILGIWENIPSESKNFEEFVQVFGLPKHAKFDRNNLIGFWKDGDKYYQRFAYWPNTLAFDLPFKLGETQTTTIQGKHVEYVYTLETGATPETPVLRVKFRQTDGDAKFTVEAAFEKDRIHATYTRDNVIAKRTYRRTLPPYVLGYFESDETTVTDEALAFFNSVWAPLLPAGVKPGKNVSFWLGRDHESDKFVEKMILDPTFYFKVKFNLDEPVTVDYKGEKMTTTYSVLETNTTSTTIRHECTSSKGTMTGTSVFDRTGVRCTVKAGDKEFTVRYRRTLSPLTYGTFEEVPEKTENWEEFMKGDEGCKMSDAMKKFTMYRKSNEEYGVQKVLNGTKTVDVVYKLDTPTEVKLPNGKEMKINVTVVNGNETVMVVRTQAGDKKFTFEKNIKPCGMAITYRRGDVEAKKYFRRVVPKIVFGTFEGPEVTDADFVEYATKHKLESFLKKSTMELSETADHKYTKKIIQDGETKETTFSLGEPFEYKMPNGKTGVGRVFFMILNNTPYIRAMYTVDNKLVFQIVSEYHADGFTATYIYGDQTFGGEKIVKRTYTRKGDPVPFEAVPKN